MVARYSDMPASRAEDTTAAAGPAHPGAGLCADSLALRGMLLLERATRLDGVRSGRRGSLPMPGIPLYIDAGLCRRQKDLFVRHRVFAVISDDGSLCLRLPQHVAADLAANGLVMRRGDNVVTGPIGSARELELAARLLQLTHQAITQPPTEPARRLWSEWVSRR